MFKGTNKVDLQVLICRGALSLRVSLVQGNLKTTGGRYSCWKKIKINHVFQNNLFKNRLTTAQPARHLPLFIVFPVWCIRKDFNVYTRGGNIINYLGPFYKSTSLTSRMFPAYRREPPLPEHNLNIPPLRSDKA